MMRLNVDTALSLCRRSHAPRSLDDRLVGAGYETLRGCYVL